MERGVIGIELTPQQAAALLAAAEWVYGSTLVQGFAVPGCSRLMLLRGIAVLTDACLAGEPDDQVEPNDLEGNRT